MASIELANVSVIFPIYNSASRSLKNMFLPPGLGGAIDPGNGNISTVEALNNVSIKINHGDRVGIVGPNGAGKTTMLQLIAGLYEPCLGDVKVDGHVAPLFDISLGMDPESTGYDNIFLRGLYLGLSKNDIYQKLNDIADFTKLGSFLNFPIRTYSAGMRMRLAFAISTSIKPDILLLDEGIGAGDAEFMNQAEARMRDFTNQAGIIVLASHSNSLIKKMCNTAVYMKRGRIVSSGSVDDILQQYAESTI